LTPRFDLLLLAFAEIPSESAVAREPIEVPESRFVQNLGLRWRRKFVDWGARGPGNRGRLEGFRIQEDGESQIADFWEQSGVYALYDGPELVYVGRATEGNGPLGSRLRAHHRDPKKADRWTAFSWLGFRRVNQDGSLQAARLPGRQVSTALAAREIEGLLIEFLTPRLNMRGGDMAHVPQFAQVRPDA
jgi:hypothetical protein